MGIFSLLEKLEKISAMLSWNLNLSGMDLPRRSFNTHGDSKNTIEEEGTGT